MHKLLMRFLTNGNAGTKRILKRGILIDKRGISIGGEMPEKPKKDRRAESKEENSQ